jgi:hypothetical protein
VRNRDRSIVRTIRREGKGEELCYERHDFFGSSELGFF